MAIAAATDFLKRLGLDSATREGLDPDAMSGEEYLAGVVQKGKEQGFIFTEDEFVQVARATHAFHQGELSDEDLAQAAGGRGAIPVRPRDGEIDYLGRVVDVVREL